MSFTLCLGELIVRRCSTSNAINVSHCNAKSNMWTSLCDWCKIQYDSPKAGGVILAIYKFCDQAPVHFLQESQWMRNTLGIIPDFVMGKIVVKNICKCFILGVFLELNNTKKSKTLYSNICYWTMLLKYNPFEQFCYP